MVSIRKPTTPRDPPTAQKVTSTSPLVLVTVKILLVLLILLLLPRLVDSKRSHKRQGRRHQFAYKVRRKQCLQGPCGSLIPEQALNCVLQCISETCFQQVYAPQPLEDGEIDYERSLLYETCLIQQRKQRDQSKS